MRHFFLPLAVLVLTLTACAPPAPDNKTEAAATATASVAPAAIVAVDPNDMAALKARLAKTLPGVTVDAVRGTPMPGIYEVQSGLNFGYVTLDGRYLIDGDLNDLATNQRLTENNRRVARLKLMDSIGATQTIEYAPSNQPAKYTVTVFTDVDCGYCRKLHQHIAEYNADGIAVRYVFYPRSGPDTPSFHKAEKVWCAKDRQAALTEAKLGAGYEGDRTCTNPVMDHLRLATQLGLRGTPAILLPDGEVVPGYQTPAELIKVLAEHGKAPAAG
ncbi:MAG: DsbC family protein [Panacagrimonas sp.]